MSFQPDLPAPAVDVRLREAVRTSETAEHGVVLWFAEMQRRRLYRDLGFSSLRQYALTAVGLSPTRAADFIRLATRLDELPRLRASVASGGLGYTKAREIVKVASPKTEELWLEEAARSSRRELEARVKKTRQEARRRRAATTGQAELLPAVTAVTTGVADPAPDVVDAVPTSVSIRMTSEQRARYDALWQALGRAPDAEDLLEAMALLAGTRAAANGSDRDTSAAVSPRGNTAPPVQVHVHRCPECGATEAAGRGGSNSSSSGSGSRDENEPSRPCERDRRTGDPAATRSEVMPLNRPRMTAVIRIVPPQRGQDESIRSGPRETGAGIPSRTTPAQEPASPVVGVRGVAFATNCSSQRSVSHRRCMIDSRAR